MSYQPAQSSMAITGVVPVSGTFWQSTQPVSLASLPALATGGNVIGGVTQSGTWNVAVSNASLAVTGTFYQATQPVSIAATVGVSGPLTDAQLRAAAVPVSGSFYPATQPVSIASMPSTAVTGTFWQATQPISGTVTVGNASLAVTGTFWQATQPVSIASMPSTPVTGTFWQATQPVSIAAAVSVTHPTLTKGTQGATGVSTQDLKDAGRAIVNAATAIGGVTGVTTEALLSLNVSRDGAATAAVTTIAVTSGKRYRITGLLASARSTAATVFSARVALRMNPSGAAVATSPILAIASMTQQAAALAEAGDTCPIMFPDGIEISGTMQVGLSQVCSGTGGVVYASLIGYEY